MGKQSSYIEQSAVIPYQIRDGELEILLITTRKKKRWIIPKGIVEPNMTPHASAAQEAFEEAGVIGEVFPEVLGSYTYQKFGGTCRVKIFLLRVDLLQPCWLEDQERDRQWFSLSQAIEQVQKAELKQILQDLPNRFQV
ncbi:NUDIX hydrolase [Gloeothece citriformis PCC 7424]|uniref:NUDIX hydrolase n=1 Tax=Gloeothece citriformis (strain PCC 7424) TaxID=65393 RepID=B7KIN1_GLOC7|nr:NUDIX hydrolase [Gloeothece citriformis]ACK69437.1 NUDIX hydrolase [Gloeothece citriformis PCC 7424]